MSSPSGLHAFSSHGPTAASTRVCLNDGFRFLQIQATHHHYARLNNNRPQAIAAHPAAVVRVDFALRRLDVSSQRVVLSREASPFSWGDVEECLLRQAAHGVYDFDDARFNEQSPIRRLPGSRDKWRRAVVAADVVIAGNDYLANRAEAHNKNVRVVPSCIDPRDYATKSDWSITGDTAELVWLGSPASEHYLAQITPALLKTHRRTGGLC